MNFYDYYSAGDTLENPCLVAALSLIENGLEIVPLVKGEKRPVDAVKDLSALRQRPLHKKNYEFFFDRDNVEIGIMLRKNMEVIDIDEKNKTGIVDKFLYSFKHGWPELYDKVVISRTPNKGVHILYYAEQIGGNVGLAGYNNEKGNTVYFIERLSESNKSYLKCSPSYGYEFTQGNPIEMPTLTIEERQWLSALASSFNECFLPEVKKTEAEREDSPWRVFNDSKDWNYILGELLDRNWQVINDHHNRVVVKMPGGKQHSGVIWKETNLLHLYTVNSEFEGGKSYSPFGVYCFYYHDNNIALACKALAADGIGKNKYEEGQFWVKRGRKLQVKYTELSHWLHGVGYRVYENEIVKITNNVVSIIDEKALKGVFLNELEPEIVDEFYERVSTIFSENGGLMAMLRKLDDKFIKDTPEQTWLFFKNYAVKITDKDVLPLQYKEIDGYIWDAHIIDRNFYNGDFDGCDADRFIRILGGEKHQSLRKIIGYTISRYKDPLNPRAVVLTEDIDAEDEGESQGGSGKGLLFSFVREFRKVADFDGKNFRLQDTFVWQSIDIDTDIIFIDDVERHFKFNGLFSILTNSLLVNKKNKHQIIIPFDRSPKVFITSNYSVGAMDISSERRKYDFPVMKYFGKDHEPIDEFGRQFFIQWDDKEWGMFDNFIADCCRMYIAETNKKSIGSVTHNSMERSLIANTHKDFIEYMDNQLSCNFFDFAPITLKTYSGYVNGVWTTNAVNYAEFNNNKTKPDYYLTMAKEVFLEKMTKTVKVTRLSMTKLSQWFKRWADSRGVEVDTRYKRNNTNELAFRIISYADKTDYSTEYEVRNDAKSENSPPF